MFQTKKKRVCCERDQDTISKVTGEGQDHDGAR